AMPALAASITSVAAASNTLAGIGLANGMIKVFDLTASDPTKGELASYQSSGSGVGAIAVVPNPAALLVASTDKSVALWPLPAAGGTKTLAGHAGQVYSVAWSPDSKLVATGSDDKTARIWDVAKGAQARQINAHEKVAYTVSFNPKGD